MKYQAVIFDLFGTLVDDFVSGIGQMNEELAGALGVPFDSFMGTWRRTAELRSAGAFQTVQASLEHACGLIGISASAEQIETAVGVRLRYTRNALQPRADALETLTELKTLGYKLGLISNCSIEIPILWPETAFADLFDAVIFSGRDCLRKPDPRIYKLACERLGVAPERCVYVADGENFELTAARRVGLNPILIRNPHRDNRKELFREAREWEGLAVTGLSQVVELVHPIQKKD
jgi:putative hydrolase of the HAD superfamily